MKVRIKDVQKNRQVETGENFLDVEMEIYDDNTEEIVETRKFAYPFGTESETIKAEAQKYLETYLQEKEQAAANAEQEELNKQADQVISDLVGYEQ